MIYHALWISIKGQVIALLLFMIFSAVMMVSCSSTKSSHRNTTAKETSAPGSICNRTVKYYLEKYILTKEDGTEKEGDKKVEVTLDITEGQLINHEI